MRKNIAIVSPHKPSLIASRYFSDRPNHVHWFFEIEALVAFLQRKQVDEIFFAGLRSTWDKKYLRQIHEMHPRIIIRSMSLSDSSKKSLPKDIQISIFPKLSQVFSKKILKCCFQPIVQLNDDARWLGVECLTRITYKGQAYDPEFLFHYAQEKLLLIEKDKACIQNSLASAPRVDALLVFINVRLQTLISPNFAEWISAEIKSAGLKPQHIVLELTEQYSHTNEQEIKNTFWNLRSDGFLFAFDDFGSGLSNFSLLDVVQPNFLKISGRFVKDIHKHEIRNSLANALIDLAQSLSIHTIVENVEKEVEMACTKNMGADYAQGFYFFHPLSKDECQAFLQSRR